MVRFRLILNFRNHQYHHHLEIVYGNIEGFRDTAEKLGGDAIKGYDQILNEKTAGIAIATASILLTKRSNVDTYTEINSYLGKLRGQQKLLDGIDIIEIIYIKRPSKDLANLRKEFNKTVRKNFLIKLTKTSEASGRFNAEDLLRMRKGNVPLNYNIPLAIRDCMLVKTL